MDEITARLSDIRMRIDRAGAFHSDKRSVTLVAVSKGQSVEQMNRLADLFARAGEVVIFGENYLQEFKSKLDKLNEPFKVHFIGQLQSNKVREVVRLFDVIQSVDSLRLAELINKEAARLGIVKEIFLQVNISSDPKKRGYDPALLMKELCEIEGLKSIAVAGLMTITENYEDNEQVRADYRALRLLKEELFGENSLLELSMGMSQDFELAIEEGSTMVRIGTALFGGRL